MAQTNRQRRRSDLERVKRLFTPDDAEWRLRLIARIEREWHLYAAP